MTLAGRHEILSHSLAAGRGISQWLPTHRHWHFSYCRLLWQDSLHHCRLLRALWTALIPYWSVAQAWWLVTHLSRGLLTARYLKAIKNKKTPASYCSKMSAVVKHFIVRDQFCPAGIKPLCAQDSFWRRQVQHNSHRNQFLSFVSSRHLYTENHLCLQNKPSALQLHGLSQGDSKCKEFVIEPNITGVGLNLSDPWKKGKTTLTR